MNLVETKNRKGLSRLEHFCFAFGALVFGLKGISVERRSLASGKEVPHRVKHPVTSSAKTEIEHEVPRQVVNSWLERRMSV